MKTDKLKRILDLEAKIKYHDYMYFEQDMPVISDAEYEEMVREYEGLLEEVPEYKPAIRVGFVEVGPSLTPIDIVEPMISVSKKKDPEEFRKWVRKNASSDAAYEDKLDGLALRLIYTKGVLTGGHNRGLGNVGGDVTHRLHLVHNVPKILTEYKDVERVEITGEAFCMFEDFNNWLERHGLDPKENDTRSSVSGLMRRGTPGEREDLPIYFKAYNASTNVRAKFEKYTDLRDHLGGLGFDLPMLLELNEVEEMMSLTSKPIGQYPIDGIVAKCNDLRKWDVEQKSEYYTYATCYKFPTISFKTKVTGIDWSLTNDGEFVGTLMYEPVEYDGTTMVRCKLDYAPSYFQRGLAIGSIISITKSNEIIPKLLGLDTVGTGKRLSYPESCPFCNQLVNNDNKDKPARCENAACEGQLTKQLVRMTDIKGFNIKGLAASRIQALVDNGFLSKHSDIFNLTESDMINSGIGTKDAKTILDQIAIVNDRDIIHWLYALAIPGLGLVRATDISNLSATNGLNDGLKFHDAKDLVRILGDSKFITELFGLDGLVIVRHIKKNEGEIFKFLSYYDYGKEHSVREVGIPIAITGTWNALTRPLMEEGLREAGYTLTDSVTKSSKCLLIADKPGASKVEKATRYGVAKVNITQVHTMQAIVSLIEALPR